MSGRLAEFNGPGFGPPWSVASREPSDLPMRGLSLSDGLVPLERAVDEWALLRAGLSAAGFRDNLIGLESSREAMTLGGVDVSQSSLLRLLTAAAAEDRPPPRDLREPFQVLDALRYGLEVARAGGRAAFGARLLFDVSARIGGRGLNGRDLPRAQQAGEEIDRLLAETAPLPLLVRAAMLAARIELQAPFGSASAAMARLALPLIVSSEGKPPLFLSTSLAANRGEYDRALADLAAGGPSESWIGAYLRRVAEAAAAAAARLRDAERRRAALAGRLDTLRSHSNAHRLAELALTMPVMTVGKAQQALEVSFQTANAAIAALVKLGVLQPHSSVRRNRIFILAGMAPA